MFKNIDYSSHHSSMGGSSGGCRGRGVVNSSHWHTSWVHATHHWWWAHHSWVVHWWWHSHTSLRWVRWSNLLFLSFLRSRSFLLLFFEAKHLGVLADANTDAANKKRKDDNNSDQSTSDSISGGQCIIQIFDVGKIEWITDSLAHCNVRLANNCLVVEVFLDLWVLVIFIIFISISDII